MPATMDPEPYAPVGADLGRSSSAGSDFDERAEFPSVLLQNPAPEQADGATIRPPFSGAQAASGTLKPAPLAVTWRTRGGLVKRCLPFATSALPECDTRHKRVRTRRG